MAHARSEGAGRGDGAPVRYPRWPARGDIISVVVKAPGFSGRFIVRGAIVRKPGHEIRCAYTDHVYRRGPYEMHTGIYHHNFHVRLRDEGRTWARGADGPEVEALQVATALL